MGISSIAADAARRAKKELPQPIEIVAMIDTGATGTVIREDILENLKLKPIGVVPISTPSSHAINSLMYDVHLYLPNNVSTDVLVVALPLRGQHIQCLIGRDFLSQGVFVYVGYDNSFTLSF